MSKLKSNPTKTVLTITVGFLVVYLATEWKWALLTSLIVGLVGITSTYISKQIDFLWMKLTWILSLIVPNILLSIIYYLFLFPIAFFSRIFGEKNPLNLKNTKDSLFKSTNKQFDKTSFENPW